MIAKAKQHQFNQESYSLLIGLTMLLKLSNQAKVHYALS